MERIKHTFLEERNLLAQIIREANLKGVCNHPDVIESRTYALDETKMIRIYTYTSARTSFSMEFGIIFCKEPKT